MLLPPYNMTHETVRQIPEYIFLAFITTQTRPIRFTETYSRTFVDNSQIPIYYTYSGSDRNGIKNDMFIVSVPRLF